MYSRKDLSLNYIEFSKKKTRIGRFAWSQKSYKEKIYFEPCFQLFKQMSWDNSKKDREYIWVKKEGDAISAITNTVIHDAENLDSFLNWNSFLIRTKTMDQELANCNKVCDIATYNRRQVCVTIKKYNVNKPPSIHV